MTYLLLAGVILLSMIFRVLALKQVKNTEVSAKEKRQKYILYRLLSLYRPGVLSGVYHNVKINTIKTNLFT